MSVVELCEDWVGQCPTDLDSALRFIEDTEELGAERRAWVQEGCGIVQLAVTDRYTVHWFVFDEQGAFVGYAYNDDGRAICSGRFAHDCPSAFPCALSPDARETGVLCACPCPRTPPGLGKQIAEPECVYNPWGFYECLETLELAVAYTSPLVRTGCGRSTVTIGGESAWKVDCMYDFGDWVGANRPDPEGELGCASVDLWYTGVPPEQCDEDTICWMGIEEPPEGVEPCPVE